MKWFIIHQWKAMRRSSIWQKNLAINIVLGFFLLLMLAYLFMLGFLIDKIMEQLYPDENPVTLFNGIILYYLGIEFLMRFFLQSLPVLDVETYLHLPIKKSAIVHYITGKSIFAIGNYLSWLVFFPFAFKVIAPAYSTGTAWVWVITVVILVFSNNFLAIYVKRLLTGNSYIVRIFGLLMITVILLDFFDLTSLSALSASVFDQLLANPLLAIVPAAILAFLYFINYHYLRMRLYTEEINVKKEIKTDALANIKYLKTWGITGHLIALDLRLIWRHKRTRSIVFMAPIFLGYGFFFYPQSIYNEMYSFLIFVGVFMTGGLMLNYLNYCFSYESNYFDNILAHYKDFERYIQSKFILAVLISATCYIITIPYVYFGTHVLLINTVTFFYNIGFLSFILLYMATYSAKRMDLSKNAAFNYQGLGASHWIAMLPAFLLPVVIYLPFGLTDYPRAGLLFVGTLGLAGLLFHKVMLKYIYKQFLKRKYIMAEGFRE
ncbi:MAG: DUF5687 family protein [Cyclobacteriaceae bacterium]|nr:DUF5687 family protein [Cyclobacteriaceae bacterium]